MHDTAQQTEGDHHGRRDHRRDPDPVLRRTDRSADRTQDNLGADPQDGPDDTRMSERQQRHQLRFHGDEHVPDGFDPEEVDDADEDREQRPRRQTDDRAGGDTGPHARPVHVARDDPRPRDQVPSQDRGDGQEHAADGDLPDHVRDQ